MNKQPENPSFEMDRLERIEMIESQFKKTIDYIRTEYDVTVCEMLGLLENAKLNIFYEQIQEEDDE